jgi:hypothetical protein
LSAAWRRACDERRLRTFREKMMILPSTTLPMMLVVCAEFITALLAIVGIIQTAMHTLYR